MESSWCTDNSEISNNASLDEIYDELNKPLKELCDEGKIFTVPSSWSAENDESSRIIEKRNEKLFTTNYMGWFSMGEESLTIGSRFDENESGFFVKHMLFTVLGASGSLSSLPLQNDDREFQNVLLSLLFIQALVAAARKGVMRTYTRREFNDSSVRGSIDVARHVKINTPFVGKIAYVTREYEMDNPVTQLIRHTIEHIGMRHPLLLIENYAVRKAVANIRECTQRYRQSDRQRVIAYNRTHQVTHPFFFEYRTLQQLCLAILANKSAGAQESSKDLQGIFFDGAWLWEQYLAKLLEVNFEHSDNKAQVGGRPLFASTVYSSYRIYPDFISKGSVDGGRSLIADAKYKDIDAHKSSDYFQLMAYMLRFGTSDGVLLYPGSKFQQIEMRLASEEEGFAAGIENACIHKIALGVSSSGCENFSVYQGQIKMNESSLCSAVAALLKAQ